MVLLREPDATLARPYLDATADYIRFYSQLIGPYPYAKFALVENFWETGYGMPSFTLLGSKVIRLPLILHSSYPHEILHNWWGNGVYVDTAGGNWSEGLTSYLADHLIREQQGRGATIGAVCYRTTPITCAHSRLFH
jgi:aminopeptidase N